MKDREQGGCDRVQERRLKHFVTLIGQRQRPALLDVLNIGEMVLKIVAAMERQHFSVVPKKNQPGEGADTEQRENFAARKIDIIAARLEPSRGPDSYKKGDECEY